MAKSALVIGIPIVAVVVLVGIMIFLYPPSSLARQEIKPSVSEPKIDTTPANKIALENQDIVKSGNLSLVQIFEKTESGVVRVNVQRTDEAGGKNSVGSGFVFDKKGNIITNAHVVNNAKKIIITFLDGRSYNAKIIGVDPFTDIAVVRVNADLDLLKPLLLGDSSNLRVGEPIAAIGNPFGLSGSMTAGIVSQLGRLLPTQEGGFSIPDVIQTDAAINPGNSGGPLLNMRGEVIGINTAIQSGTGEFTGVGFAVPSQTVAKIVPSLIQNGAYKHPWLGVTGRDIDPDLAAILNLKDSKGFLIVSVIEDGPAAKAGLHGSDKTIEVDGAKYAIGGDVILSIDGKDVRKIDDILTHLQRAKSVGDKIELEVLRDGRTSIFVVTLEERPNGN